MLKGIKADQFAFGTVNVMDNPVHHGDTNSSSVMENLRPMPGQWVRSWGGRKARKFNHVDGRYLQFHEFRDPQFSGWPTHLEQYVDETGVVKWRSLALSNFLEQDVEGINGSYDLNYGADNPVAVANLRERVVMYNGQGVRDGAGSRPPFSGWDGTSVQYFGLDCFNPSGALPLVGTSAGTITITSPVKVYVGLHNTNTLHFSNGKYVGEVAAGANIQIDLTQLNRIVPSYHVGVEQGNLVYVFYATLPGLSVPYLLMAADGITPLSQFVISTSYTITLLKHDLTKEMPITNHPPRPMRWLANVGGRLYGAYLDTSIPGGSWPLDDFSYQTGNPRFLCGLAYSAAVNDLKGRSYLGNPEESWPIGSGYFTPTPNSMIPLMGLSSPDQSALVVWTAIATYRVSEAADRFHEWQPLSNIHGIGKASTAVTTAKGVIWLTQRNQIAMYVSGYGEGSVVVLSDKYQHLLSRKTAKFATYTLDPVNHIDRYEVYFTDGTCVVHDFKAGGGYLVSGSFGCGKTLTDYNNRQYHILANNAIYTHAGQPENGRERLAEETFDAAGAVVVSSIVSKWGTQWLSYGDPTTRKEFICLTLCADGAGERTNGLVDVALYADTGGMGDNNKIQGSGRELNVQSGGPIDVTASERTGLAYYDYKFSSSNYFKFKFLVTITGRTDLTDHPAMDEYGNSVAENGHHSHFAGALFSAHHELRDRKNA